MTTYYCRNCCAIITEYAVKCGWCGHTSARRVQVGQKGQPICGNVKLPLVEAMQGREVARG